mmetsp:Transcript_60356/g.97706  ORF Transcript_60356/g.97706 Transcript_60356/m.97706 type:complete len:222 (+) Transcript_60356:140-805(+)
MPLQTTTSSSWRSAPMRRRSWGSWYFSTRSLLPASMVVASTTTGPSARTRALISSTQARLRKSASASSPVLRHLLGGSRSTMSLSACPWHMLVMIIALEHRRHRRPLCHSTQGLVLRPMSTTSSVVPTSSTTIPTSRRLARDALQRSKSTPTSRTATEQHPSPSAATASSSVPSVPRRTVPSPQRSATRSGPPARLTSPSTSSRAYLCEMPWPGPSTNANL